MLVVEKKHGVPDCVLSQMQSTLENIPGHHHPELDPHEM